MEVLRNKKINHLLKDPVKTITGLQGNRIRKTKISKLEIEIM
jgi:hypothetical protein